MQAIGWLVDTNVLSEGRKLRASEKVRAFMTGQTKADALYERGDIR